MKEFEIYPPLKTVQDSVFANLMSWDEIEQIRLTLRQLGRNWYEDIYIPSWGMCLGIQMLRDLDISKNSLNANAIILAALSSWRRCKEVYRFAPELESMLYAQADDCKIPVGILQQMPYSCIYVETPNLCPGKYHGFIVMIDQDKDKTMLILRCIGISPTGELVKNYDVMLVAGTTLSDGIASSYAAELNNVLGKEKMNIAVEEMVAEVIDREYVLSRLLQLILYLCVRNSDVGYRIQSD